MTWRIHHLLLVACVFLLTGFANASGTMPTIIGTWETEVDTHVDPPFQALLSFSGSKTVMVVDSRPRDGETITTGLGTWKRISQRTFEFVFKRFHFDADGQLLFTFEVRETVVVSQNANTYRGEGVATMFFADGTVVKIPGVFNTSGKRLGG